MRIKPKAMQVLQCLAGASPEVVTRNELFDRVWPGSVVSDDALTQCIVELRKAFGDSPQHGKVIETIPKRGFRLVPDTAPVEASADDPPPPAKNKLLNWLPAAALVPIILAAVIHFNDARDAGPVAAAVPEKSLAVLPFVDMSSESDQGHFADGLSEELITQLSRLEGLLVTGRTSSFRFQDSDEDLRTIGGMLGVRHILEGSVRRSGEQIRVTAQLIDVESGFHVWADTYDRPLCRYFRGAGRNRGGPSRRR